MPALPLTTLADGRPSYGLPSVRMANMFVEKTVAGPDEVARLPRPGLTPQYTVDAPVRRFFRQGAVFGGAVFAATDLGLYSTTPGSTNPRRLGNIATGSPRMAASPSQVAVVAGGNLYVWNGAALVPVKQFSSGGQLPPFSDVCYLGGRFILPQQGSNSFYYSDLGDATSINGLSFETIQSTASPIVSASILSDSVAFHCDDKTEFWQVTSDFTNPFQYETGRIYERGNVAQATCLEIDNALTWVGNDLKVYRSGLEPERISTNRVEEALRKCTNITSCTAFRAVIDGHDFYVLNIPGQTTFALDVATKQWGEWDSYNLPNYRCGASAVVDGVTYLGDARQGSVYLFDPTNLTDAGQPIQRVVSGFIPLKSGVLRCANVMLQCVRGVGLATGQGSSPLVEMRYSDDAGRTFSNWYAASLGKIGQYGLKAVWRGLGTMRSPGRYFEFRCSDPVNFVVESATFNEARV